MLYSHFLRRAYLVVLFVLASLAIDAIVFPRFVMAQAPFLGSPYYGTRIVTSYTGTSRCWTTDRRQCNNE